LETLLVAVPSLALREQEGLLVNDRDIGVAVSFCMCLSYRLIFTELVDRFCCCNSKKCHSELWHSLPAEGGGARWR